MNSRFVLLAIGLLALGYNCLRMFATITGKTWRLWPAFGGLPMTGAQIGCSFSLIVVSLLLAQFSWLRDYRTTLLPSAGWGAISGAAASLLAIYLGTKNDYGYGFAVFLFTLVLTGFHSAFHLGSRGKFGLGDAVLAGLLSIVLLGFAMLAFAL